MFRRAKFAKDDADGIDIAVENVYENQFRIDAEEGGAKGSGGEDSGVGRGGIRKKTGGGRWAWPEGGQRWTNEAGDAVFGGEEKGIDWDSCPKGQSGFWRGRVSLGE